MDEIVAELKAGAVVAVPTETVYGLAVRYDDHSAIEKLMRLKDRDPASGKVFSLMLADADQIGGFAVESEQSRRLAHDYFPGELTLVLPRKSGFKNAYFDNFETIGIRVPNHEFMLQLLRLVGPLIVTSANSRGGTPAVTSGEVVELLPCIDVCVGGAAGANPPSTVVRVVGDKTEVLRHGSLLVS